MDENSKVVKKILATIKDLNEKGYQECYGFQIAEAMDTEDTGDLIAFGTLYRGLEILERGDILTSRWEELPPGAKRPRRRYYSLKKPVNEAVKVG